jgi:hypothetical protein
VYINSTTTDFYQKSADEWGAPLFQLKGKDGKTPRLGVDYQNGRTPQLGVDYFNGRDGKNTYELAVQDGFTGTLTQWLASLKPAAVQAGAPGADGNRNRWESYAPTDEAGLAGNAWYHVISAAKISMYECYQAAGADKANAWRLRYTSPDAAATTVVTQNPTGNTGNTGGVNLTNQGDGTKYLANDGTYKTVSQGSSLPALSGQSGKVLSTDGTNLIWAAAAQGGANLPALVAGRVLSNDGVNLSWVSATSVPTASKKLMPMVFTDDADYENGNVGAPLNGAITLDHTGAVRGCTVGLYHRDSSAPVMPPECECIGGGYLANRTNFFAFTYEGPALILYTVTQRP